ncbi:uncharacterized protein [Oscarella lobularis]
MTASDAETLVADVERLTHRELDIYARRFRVQDWSLFLDDFQSQIVPDNASSSSRVARQRRRTNWPRFVCAKTGRHFQLEHLQKAYLSGSSRPAVRSEAKTNRVVSQLQEVAPGDRRRAAAGERRPTKSIGGRVSEVLDSTSFESTSAGCNENVARSLDSPDSGKKEEVFYRLSRPKHTPPRLNSKLLSTSDANTRSQSVFPLKNPELFDRLAAPRSAGPLSYRFAYPTQLKTEEKRKHKSVGYDLFERLAKPKIRLHTTSWPSNAKERSNVNRNPILSTGRSVSGVSSRRQLSERRSTQGLNDDASFKLAVDSIIARRHSRMYSSATLDPLEVTREASCLLEDNNSDKESNIGKDDDDNDDDLFLSSDEEEEQQDDDGDDTFPDELPSRNDEDSRTIDQDIPVIRRSSTKRQSRTSSLTVEGILKFADLLLDDDAEPANGEGCTDSAASADENENENENSPVLNSESDLELDT